MLQKSTALIILSMLLTINAPVWAADGAGRMQVDNDHVSSWNTFADQILALHKKQIEGRAIKETAVTGGYRDNPDYYRQVTYTDQKTGKVLSIVQWQTDDPEVVHSIEAFVYDAKGRVIRDYSASYLPGSRNAPVQTLINLHHYNGSLHAFRQFDASKDIIYEYCQGEFNGQQHELRLFEDDLAAVEYDSRQVLKSPLYKACFKGLRTYIGRGILPINNGGNDRTTSTLSRS